MVPRRVLLRIKKLRRFLDERIREAVRRREEAEDAEVRAEADGRLSAYQEIRGEMVGERLDLAEVDLEEGSVEGEARSAGEGEATTDDAGATELPSPLHQ